MSSSCHHGFSRRRSTVTILLELTCCIHDAFSERKSADVIYTEFWKASYKDNHSLLPFKLKSIGFSGNIFSWHISLLTGRSRDVFFKSSFFPDISVSLGVRQGSHFGPLLSVLFVNEHPTSVQNARLLVYADGHIDQ